MNILTFDTSLDKTYVTLSSAGNILASSVIENHNEKYHSAFLIPEIVSILKSNNLSMKDINVIGTNVGPGSFTGIRACVTVARVFAQQLEIPLVGISSLEILSHLNDSDKETLVVLDARKNKYYTAIYKANEEILKPCLTDAEDLLKMNLFDYLIIADSSSHAYLSDNGVSSRIYTDKNENLGLFLNKIVFNKINSTPVDNWNWGKLKPLYLQAPPITVSNKVKA